MVQYLYVQQPNQQHFVSGLDFCSYLGSLQTIAGTHQRGHSQTWSEQIFVARSPTVAKGLASIKVSMLQLCQPHHRSRE